ncbi:hypothetical protein S40288_00592 [Stachybotrys chartarum IBT 40288]|nr:hypothetical protein S40288_00592 [Stachybotrys chartarum IBT 40288]
MVLKDFNADVAAAKGPAVQGVNNVRRGDSEGELVFTYSHQELDKSMDIQALATNVDCYPLSTGWMIFTSTDSIGHDLVPVLEGLAVRAKGMTVGQIIETISTTLNTVLVNQDFTMSDHEPSEASYDSLDEYYDIDSADAAQFVVNNSQRLGNLASASSNLGLDDRKRMARDLHSANEAGFIVGFPGAFPGASLPELVSLAIRASKLGIPADVLEAWNIDPAQYLVLLLQYPSGYPSAQDFMHPGADGPAVELRFGKCSTPKPSSRSSRSAFLNSLATGAARIVPGQQMDKDHFEPVHVSNTIDALLKSQLRGLLIARRSENLDWDQAQKLLFHVSRGSHKKNTHSDDSFTLGDEQMASQDPPISTHAPVRLQHDHALDPEEDLNIPLVCMQFALRRLVRCTQYCMVCHQKVPNSFDALKPYVCSASLCLYQYFSLGFGNSLEHEIFQDPYTVDLLVSFFYSAVYRGGLREFPRGLGLTAPRQCSIPKEDVDYITAQVCFKTKTMVFPQEKRALPVKKGGVVRIVVPGPKQVFFPTPDKDEGLSHYCLITAIDTTATFEILTPEARLANDSLGAMTAKKESSLPVSDVLTQVLLFPDLDDVDDLSEPLKSISLILLTSWIPSILEMRKQLLQQPGKSLSSVVPISKSSFTLLNWIIASNRSFIVQDGPVPSTSREDEKLEIGDGEDTNMHTLQGVGDGWMHFRFIQGSPEKEHRFNQALAESSALPDYQPQFPTLFAWHGSSIRNWHSIIRTGLDFGVVSNGRAYGDGVYFSSDMRTSLSYSGMHGSNTLGGSLLHRNALTVSRRYFQHSGKFATHLCTLFAKLEKGYRLNWPNSELNMTSAISICEIINRTKEFRSFNPHFVVDKVDWIQCRYLLVHVDPSSEAGRHRFPKAAKTKSAGYIEQDPSHKLKGHGATLVEIPRVAPPGACRESNGATSSFNPQQGSKEDPINLDGSDEEDRVSASEDGEDDDNHEIDRVLRLLEDKPSETTGKRSREASSEITHLDPPSSIRLRIADHEVDSTCRHQPAAPSNVTHFDPGTIDVISLERLPEPSWASSSISLVRTLTKEIKDLQKVQSTTNMASLGWYIDFNNLSNVFQWIVELHSFDRTLPLAQDMEKHRCNSIVLELRFGKDYPLTPPFVRVVRPRFLPFMMGGGGHVTAGGSICSEALTSSAWTPVMKMEALLLQIRLQLCSLDPPARLDGHRHSQSYSIGEALDGYRRSAAAHGWKMPAGIEALAGTVW